jgi:short-subunit dehydrogenase
MARTALETTKGVARLRERYGPWAVVTGASSGIGRELAVQLAQAGLNLVLVARREAVLVQLAKDLGARYVTNVRVIAADLGKQEGVDKVEAETQGLDVGLLAAAAGFGTSGKFLDASVEEELNMLSVNCRTLMLQSLHFGRRFAERGRGGIILMSSIVGLQGTPNAAHYAATKAYVHALAEALHVELAPQGVDVLASTPGPTHSGFAERANMKMGAALDPAKVARETLSALGRRAVVLPGLLSKVLTYSLAPLPRWARVRIMGRVMASLAVSKGERVAHKGDPTNAAVIE